MLRVTAVTPLDPHRLRVEFNDGVVRDVDCAFLLHGTLGEPLRDPDSSGKSASTKSRGRSCGRTGWTRRRGCSTATTNRRARAPATPSKPPRRSRSRPSPARGRRVGCRHPEVRFPRIAAGHRRISRGPRLDLIRARNPRRHRVGPILAAIRLVSAPLLGGPASSFEGAVLGMDNMFPMIVLHAIWSRDARLCVWGEDGRLPASAPRRRGRPPLKPRPRRHPFAAPVQEFARALGEVSRDLDSGERRRAACALAVSRARSAGLAAAVADRWRRRWLGPTGSSGFVGRSHRTVRRRRRRRAAARSSRVTINAAWRSAIRHGFSPSWPSSRSSCSRAGASCRDSPGARIGGWRSGSRDERSRRLRASATAGRIDAAAPARGSWLIRDRNAARDDRRRCARRLPRRVRATLPDQADPPHARSETQSHERRLRRGSPH